MEREGKKRKRKERERWRNVLGKWRMRDKQIHRSYKRCLGLTAVERRREERIQTKNEKGAAERKQKGEATARERERESERERERERGIESEAE